MEEIVIVALSCSEKQWQKELLITITSKGEKDQ